jgi:hypothetical protein
LDDIYKHLDTLYVSNEEPFEPSSGAWALGDNEEDGADEATLADSVASHSTIASFTETLGGAPISGSIPATMAAHGSSSTPKFISAPASRLHASSARSWEDSPSPTDTASSEEYDTRLVPSRIIRAFIATKVHA